MGIIERESGSKGLTVIDILAALAHQKRQKIFEIVYSSDGPVPFSEIAGKSNLKKSDVYFHLCKLVENNLIRELTKPIINDETGKPIYKFYEPTQTGTEIYEMYDIFLEDINKTVRYIGFDPDKEQRAFESGIKARISIIRELRKSEEGLFTYELMERLGDHVKSQSTLSHHLKRLYDLDIVEYKKADEDSRKHRYSLSEKVPVELLMLLSLSNND